MIRMFRKLGSAALGAMLLVAGGCSDAAQPVAVAETGPLLAAGSGGPDVSRLARFQKRPQITIAWAKKWIGPEGGRLDFQGFAIEVPAGAVDRVTMFSIRLPVKSSGADHVVAEFSPHGASFAVPVAIELPYAGTSIEGAAQPTVVWWNSAWVDMGATVTADGKRLRTLTDHFSTYGTTDRSGALAVSGG
jgi:hypothetical protein